MLHQGMRILGERAPVPTKAEIAARVQEAIARDTEVPVNAPVQNLLRWEYKLRA